MILLIIDVYVFKQLTYGINQARWIWVGHQIIKYLKGESPSLTKQPHVYKHEVLNVIAFDPTRRRPVMIKP